LRLPNYVKYEPRPFEPESYVDVKPEDDKGQKVGADRSLSTQMEISNTLRWRWVQRPDGKYVSNVTLPLPFLIAVYDQVRQSNSRIIKWDDGSMSLQLGKELYDFSVNVDTSASISRSTIHGVGASQSLPSSQPIASQSTPSQVDVKPDGPIKGNGLAYVVSQHPEAAILRTEAQITGTMGLRPAGLQGSIHNKFRKALQQKHSKVSRLRFAQDEEVTAVERQIAELQKKPWKTARSTGGDGTRRRRSGGRSGIISAAERRRRAADMYSDEDEAEESDGGSDAGGYGGSRPSARRPAGDTKRGPGEYEPDGFLVPDEDEEDEGGRSPAKKRKRDKAEEDVLDEPDDLEMMDARIERQQKDRRPATPDMEDDEEEEAATAIRKSSGKRRAAFVAGSDEE
jgi:RNA polymerase-associated protein LEO1